MDDMENLGHLPSGINDLSKSRASDRRAPFEIFNNLVIWSDAREKASVI